MATRRDTSAVVAALLVAVAGACTLLNPLDAYGPPTVKALAEGGPGPAAPTDGGCALARWPGPPAADDGTDELTLTFAATSFTPGIVTAGKPVGYDLDGVCTCPAPPSCKPSPNAKSVCDADGGVDNGGSQQLDKFLSLAENKGGVTQAILEGRGGLLVVIRNYNGQPNDTKVAVEVFASPGTQPPTPDGNSPTPNHDGNDVWTVDRTSLYGGSGPPYISKVVDTQAYVAGGIVVGHMDIAFNLADLAFDLRQATVTARVVKNGNRWNLETGVLAGRWPTARLLTSLDTLKDPFVSSGGLCGTSALYQSIKGDVCGAVDLMQDSKLDNTDTKCDSVGLAISFTAETAVMGDIMDEKPAKHLCGDGWADNCP